MSEFIERAMQSAVGNGIQVVEDTEFAKAYPAVHAFLTCRSVKGIDGEVVPRLTSTLNIFQHDGVPKAFLNDRASGRSLSVTAPTFLGLFRVLEEALTAEHVQWRWMDRAETGRGTTARKKKT